MTSFLSGAKGRLLPASVPFRFFAAAAAFHVLMWAVLLADAPEAKSFRGGPATTLGAVHLLTLGVLVTTAIGASLQLLPVATRRPLAAVWPIKLVFWLTVPGTAMLSFGMWTGQVPVIISAAAPTTIGLLLFAALLAGNLQSAASLPVVALYSWTSLAALILLAALGLALSFDYALGVLPDHQAAALAHMILGGFGFMGFFALGFSHILVPMFALSAPPARQVAFVEYGLAVTGLALGTYGALAGSVLALTCAGLVGLSAAATHLWQMHNVLKTGMRKRLGISFLLVRTAWIMLPATLVVGLAALHGLAGPNGPTLFGFLLIGGWLLTFLLGVLQRILPFLASMHAPRSAGGTLPLMSELAASRPVKVHAVCHGLALAGLIGAIALDVAWPARISAGAGLVGAAAFAWFTADIVRRAVVAH